ncbi:unnamed protein product [Owenia fusiformis]|uniref:C-type lectin domain-containing protein n=1 Tax=Owenia fusiformis TaxID=6347 RepID=A0A8S4Q3N1_OWEFU|nr:unnamed protein product [Owenia fusiformis]
MWVLQRSWIILTLLTGQIALGWESFGDKEYEAFYEGFSWYDSQLQCETINGHLVIFESTEELEFVRNLIHDDEDWTFWIGANDTAVEDEWRWVDGSLVDNAVKDFFPGTCSNKKCNLRSNVQPNNGVGTATGLPQDCVDIRRSWGSAGYSDHHYWNDEVCDATDDQGDDTRGYICERGVLTTVPTTIATTVMTTDTTTQVSTKDATIEASTTDATTEATSEASTTDPTTEASTTDPTTEASTTDATTEASTTDPTTEASTADATTEASTTDPATEASTTDATTEASTTGATTKASTTDATTEASTTVPTTETSSTDATTEASTSDATTEAITMDATTKTSTTDATTEASTTDATTTARTTDATTKASTTDSTSTTSATTELSTTDATTEANTMDPTSEASTMGATTEASAMVPTSEANTMGATTEASTMDPTSEANTMGATTEASTTDATTEATITDSTTEAITIATTREVTSIASSQENITTAAIVFPPLKQIKKGVMEEETFTDSDKRPSAMLFGISGLVILLTILGVIVLFDIITAWGHMQRLNCIGNLRNFKHMTMKEVCMECWCSQDKRFRRRMKKKKPKLTMVIYKYRKYQEENGGIDPFSCDVIMSLFWDAIWTKLKTVCCKPKQNHRDSLSTLIDPCNVNEPDTSSIDIDRGSDLDEVIVGTTEEDIESAESNQYRKFDREYSFMDDIETVHNLYYRGRFAAEKKRWQPKSVQAESPGLEINDTGTMFEHRFDTKSWNIDEKVRHNKSPITIEETKGYDNEVYANHRDATFVPESVLGYARDIYHDDSEPPATVDDELDKLVEGNHHIEVNETEGPTGVDSITIDGMIGSGLHDNTESNRKYIAVECAVLSENKLQSKNDNNIIETPDQSGIDQRLYTSRELTMFDDGDTPCPHIESYPQTPNDNHNPYPHLEANVDPIINTISDISTRLPDSTRDQFANSDEDDIYSLFRYDSFINATSPNHDSGIDTPTLYRSPSSDRESSALSRSFPFTMTRGTDVVKRERGLSIPSIRTFTLKQDTYNMNIGQDHKPYLSPSTSTVKQHTNDTRDIKSDRKTSIPSISSTVTQNMNDWMREYAPPREFLFPEPNTDWCSKSYNIPSSGREYERRDWDGLSGSKTSLSERNKVRHPRRHSDIGGPTTDSNQGKRTGNGAPRVVSWHSGYSSKLKPTKDWMREERNKVSKTNGPT